MLYSRDGARERSLEFSFFFSGKDEFVAGRGRHSEACKKTFDDPNAIVDRRELKRVAANSWYGVRRPQRHV